MNSSPCRIQSDHESPVICRRPGRLLASSLLLAFSFASLAVAPPAQAQADGYNRFAPMADAFLDMMESMADAYNRRREEYAGGYRWDEPVASAPATPQIGDGEVVAIGDTTPSLPPSIIEGWWLGESGEVLAFKRDRFRIYIGPEEYREGRIRIRDWELTLVDPVSSTERIYEFALQDNYLALRDASDAILYYIKVRQ